MNVYIVIPAYNPGEELVEYVLQLINKGFDRILLVDDGSRQECKRIFHALSENQSAHCSPMLSTWEKEGH